MKLLVLLLVGLVTTTFSCKKSDDVAPATTTATTIDVKSVMPTGNWSVSLFQQRTEDKSSNFKDITFVFSADGSVTATQGNKSTKGSWIYSPAVTYYGGNGLSSLTLNLGTSKPFDLLNRTWNVNTESTTSSLKLDNKEPLEDEHLIFQNSKQ
ncbi:hypothetical protein EXU85_25645 [Spirosoma sp. KCTC 42546]|uniref:hypothetical protein n=1 Tax=Spirosoma sp. KCTC 42546 TaxID=2520506 RepID=UPI00115B4D10|nr:hypothetical protein [Spirosoma sp. KCTC 42546]QDK81811.1 hypothetical protein EXU85_25645 [Spirosoma sp. KCTC 42546]